VTTKARQLKRIPRGVIFHPGRYWSAFTSGSLIVHLLILLSFSDMLLTYIRSFRGIEVPPYRVLDVDIVNRSDTHTVIPTKTITPPDISVPEAVRTARRVPTHAKPAAPRLSIPEQATPKPSERIPIAANAPQPVQAAHSSRAPVSTYSARANITNPVSPEHVSFSDELAADEPRPESRYPLPERPADESVLVVKGTGKAFFSVAPRPAGGASPRPSPATMQRAGEDAPAAPSLSPAATALLKPPVNQAGSKASALLPMDEPDADTPARLDIAKAAEPMPVPPAKMGTSEPTPLPRPLAISGKGAAQSEAPGLRISEPVPGDTDKGLVDVKGIVGGLGIRSVYLVVGKKETEILVKDGTFKAAAALDVGTNIIEASAVDSSGRVARDRVVVNYTPEKAGRITLTSPKDKAVIDAFRQKEVTIQGSVEAKGAVKVRIYLNNAITDISAPGGLFSVTTPVKAEDNVLYAEATDASGRTYRSEDVHFTAVNLFPKDLAVRANYPSDAGVRLTWKWRPHPLLDKHAPKPDAPEWRAAEDGKGGSASVGEAVAGIYTIGVEYDIPEGRSAEASFDASVYGYDQTRKKARKAGPITLKGKGYLPAVRVLMPEAVFWEDETWFSGMIEASGSYTKFKSPEGIVWTEEK